MNDLPPRTDWYPATIDPVRIGWYECRYYDYDIPQLYWWDGFLWRYGPEEPLTAFGNGGADAENESWRGLTENVEPWIPVARRLRRDHAS